MDIPHWLSSRCSKYLCSDACSRSYPSCSPVTYCAISSDGKQSSTQKHSLTIRNCILNRNQWGVYLSGKNTTITLNHFLENGRGAMYSGSRSGENVIKYNVYRDNGYVPEESYADIVMDTAYKTTIEYNQFIKSQYIPLHFSAAVSFFRNMGEDSNLRENAPHLNIIQIININDRQIGIHMGARMGRDYEIYDDITQEGRDYGYYNIIQSNDFNDVTIGIKINTSGNTVCSNTFIDVDRPIVLNCVFYSLTENTINNQMASDVYFWAKYLDYITYAWMFLYQWERNRHIDESEKIFHIRTDYGSGGFNYAGTAAFIESPTLMVEADAIVADFGSDKKINFSDYSKLLDYWQNVASFNNPVSGGLILHLDSCDVAVTQSAGIDYVTGWDDLSGNNNAFQVTSNKKPILTRNVTPAGGAAVKFDGIDDYLEINPNSSFDRGTFTLLAVYAIDTFASGSGTGRLINLGYADTNPGDPTVMNTGAYALVTGGATAEVRAFSCTINGGGVIVNSGVPAGYAEDKFYIAAATMDSTSTNVKSYLVSSTDDITSSTTGANAIGVGNLVARIGAGVSSNSSTNPAYYFNGWIAEVLIYNRILTPQEISEVSEYLKNKHFDSQGGLDPNLYKLNRFIGSPDRNLDLGSFVSYWLEDIPMNDAYSSGGTPIDIAVGDFYTELAGDEVAVIWSSPVTKISESSTVNNTYYTIIIYDSNGIEINRLGRSTRKWQAIAAGDFLSNTGDEIAAVSAESENGYYFQAGIYESFSNIICI